jgi:hypothetical protein
MKAEETASSPPSSTRRKSYAPIFSKVVDGRKQSIRGLWVRNGKFYAHRATSD